MPRLARILCPVDLSEASRRALTYALGLGREHGAAVRVVQVIDVRGWAGAALVDVGAILDEARTTAEEQLGWWVAKAVGTGGGASTELREGAVVPGILAAADEFDADLLVLGTHGRSGFERLALGSVAEKTVRRSTRPVCVVPSREDAVVRTGTPSRVVCATDFSESSLHAVSYGQLLTTTAPAALSLVTVIDWPFGETRGNDPVTQLRQSLTEEATAQLRRVADAAGVGESATLAVRQGRAGREILKYAREHHAEIVVVGVSGRGAIDRALLGSTAQQILRDAPCPVLAVPATAVPAGGVDRQSAR